MPVETWSENVLVAHMADDPQFAGDMLSLERSVTGKRYNVVLDFGAVHFINSSNIARLLKLRKQVNASESRLILCNVNTHVWGTFLVTGLDKIFQFADNVSLALATLQMK
jgi:anti-anti-sigma factor